MTRLLREYSKSELVAIVKHATLKQAAAEAQLARRRRGFLGGVFLGAALAGAASLLAQVVR